MSRKFFWTSEDIKWNIQCRYNFWLHGPYGLARVIERMPFRYITKYLKKYGADIGENAIIDTGIIIHRPDKHIPFKNLVFGSNIYIGHNTLFDLSEMIIIENNVKLGASCQLWTHIGFNSIFESETITQYTEIFKQIRIKKNAICYSGVVISPGVIIGENCRVGANSVVNKDIPANSFCAGNPAKVKKSFSKEYL